MPENACRDLLANSLIPFKVSTNHLCIRKFVCHLCIINKLRAVVHQLFNDYMKISLNFVPEQQANGSAAFEWMFFPPPWIRQDQLFRLVFCSSSGDSFIPNCLMSLAHVMRMVIRRRNHCCRPE